MDNAASFEGIRSCKSHTSTISQFQNSKIHFLGIGGVGMAALAVLMKGEGGDVSGCDLKATPRTKWLESLGIPVAIGHHPSHVADVDCVVATPAVAKDNPEFLASFGKVRYRGEVLAEIVSHRDSIAVCGSHGKTTTATFTAKLLMELGEDVAWAIGGETGDFPVARIGSGPLVVEADESDGTLALYHASTLVVTNCEYDHPDHFPTVADYMACFDTARRNAADVIESEHLSLDGWDIPVVGEHNIKNARAAIEVALRRGHSRERIAACLPQVVVQLPDRRFQRLSDGVYTDYAHHPTEMKCAVSMARSVCNGVLRVLFQPHRYSRTKALLNDFPASFAGADEVILCPTYPAFEPPIEGGHVADLYAAIRAADIVPKFFLARSCEEAWKHAAIESRPGDVTLILGAGNLLEKTLEGRNLLRPHINPGATNCIPTAASFFRTENKSVGGGKRIFVGMGSNLWVTDLTTDDEYIRTTGPAAQPGATLGIPWMVGIPGTIGGWVKMNAGAFGHSISEVISRVKVDGKWLDKSECGFAYRHSSITGEIQDVEFVGSLQLAVPNSQLSTPNSYAAKRRQFPARCCGSVFKNPEGDFAGRLLEAAGVKGLRVGGAYVWSEHANVIAASDGATASDILALAQICRSRVLHRFGIPLDFEIQGLSASD